MPSVEELNYISGKLAEERLRMQAVRPVDVGSNTDDLLRELIAEVKGLRTDLRQRDLRQQVERFRLPDLLR